MTNSGTKVAKFSLAVDNPFKKDDPSFPNFVAFGKTADFIEKWIDKGGRVVVESNLKTGSYEKDDGTKVYTNDFMVNKIHPIDWKEQGGGNTNNSSLDEFAEFEDPNSEVPF